MPMRLPDIGGIRRDATQDAVYYRNSARDDRDNGEGGQERRHCFEDHGGAGEKGGEKYSDPN